MTIDLAPAPLSPTLAGESQEARALRQVLERVNEHSCPYFYNFHLHTQFSDGRLLPEEIIEQAIALGLKGLAITDHHGVGGYKMAREWLDLQDSDRQVPQLWSGIEVNASLLNTEVHILGYGFDPDSPAIAPYTRGHATTGEDYQAESAIAAIHAAGGLAVLAHPARYRRGAAELIPEAARWGIDGIETYYAYNNPYPWTPSPKQMARVKQLGETYGLIHSCGTDTHGQSIEKRV
ncbi:PHP domain-containing protein [Roseofilum casamattae]|uniref:PHP domain-containing protein n=1 Tax=Roseofilum casamattae BLCC-M143 TaxID=3022442 RepID=A0ABT7BZP0_9CYAN|nr:PHP domain-containing protein [Roseofilum casamattae]MDJ1184674.1 PHP domain-containing protein [Roseofilum casamattae BLCC-M143]